MFFHPNEPYLHSHPPTHPPHPPPLSQGKKKNQLLTRHKWAFGRTAAENGIDVKEEWNSNVRQLPRCVLRKLKGAVTRALTETPAPREIFVFLLLIKLEGLDKTGAAGGARTDE